MTTTDLPPPGDLPEVQIDPAIYRHLADAQAHTVIDLAGQQPQGQANHAFAMSQHTLYRVMGFAGVGGAQNGGDRAMAGHG